jgi:phenylpropionate dioxygenase-like ring-hydroxylating dioxygenase large terminal subunit
MVDINKLVDTKASTQSKEVFWDQEVYDREIKNIFGRSWLFLTHECMLEKKGDFITTKMAEDSVIVTRHTDGSLKAFVNSCTHRGNSICSADSGNTKSFVCNYHGWVFSTDGKLVDVPLREKCYHDELDRDSLSLKTIRVESYRGFVFGCFDETAPSLEDFLGDWGWYLDTWMVGAGEGAELVGPPMKSILKCNWKVPTENFVGDGYHVGWTHASALHVLGGELGGLAGNQAEMPFDELGIQVTTRHGHGFGVIDNAAIAIHAKRDEYAKYMEETIPKVAENLGEPRAKLFNGHWNCSTFPNCSFLYGTNIFKVWHPRGPHEIEVWSWVIVHKDMSDEGKREVVKQAARSFGTAGTLESDDGDNMVQSTHVNRGSYTREGAMNSTMGQGYEGEHPDYPGIVGSSFIGETSYRGFYRFYQEMMSADSWDDIRANDEHWADCFPNKNYWKDRIAAKAAEAEGE